MTIRFATPTDAQALVDIYGPYILNTSISFEYEVPSVDEFAGRIHTIQQQQLPYLVAEKDGRILGYAYAGRHRERIAYQWSADTSVYVHPDGHRKGIARSLYTHLLELLRRQGYYNAYAGITLPNLASENFHHSMGFELIGVYPKVGYKMGTWHDVAWFQLTLQPHQPNPAPPISISGLQLGIEPQTKK
ncbi:MAG TPA: arsinothricin resistance N-acetyltransferase ArsN1 family B [Hymenobacter sp.]|jgi:phosphinothricin acetyltransferase|nr:arsinothricin resistance N-acetyltransferase ArsN1 family B [Hymenobacter sp.]